MEQSFLTGNDINVLKRWKFSPTNWPLMPHRETADVQPKNSLLTGKKCRNAAKRFLFVSVELNDH